MASTSPEYRSDLFARKILAGECRDCSSPVDRKRTGAPYLYCEYHRAWRLAWEWLKGMRQPVDELSPRCRKCKQIGHKSSRCDITQLAEKIAAEMMKTRAEEKKNREVQKELRRINLGLCRQCSAQALPDFALCATHRDEQNQRNFHKRNQLNPNRKLKQCKACGVLGHIAKTCSAIQQHISV